MICLKKKKIKEVDMKCCFEDYENGNDYDAATEFLKQEFISRNEYPKKKFTFMLLVLPIRKMFNLLLML